MHLLWIDPMSSDPNSEINCLETINIKPDCIWCIIRKGRKKKQFNTPPSS